MVRAIRNERQSRVSALSQYDIDLTEFIKLGKPQVDNNHLWGRELLYHLSPPKADKPYCLKLIELQKPHVLSSYHHHENTTETLLVLSGTLSLRIESPVFHLYYPGQFVTINPYQNHQFFAVHNPCLVMEGSNRSDPNDDVKVSPSGEVMKE